VRSKIEEQKQDAEIVLRNTQQKMAEIEMQALRAQMNPHFIFNCLNSINRYIVKSDQATASLYLTRFAKLIRLILDNSNSQYISLSSELEALRLYIEMESIRFEKQFTYSIIVDEDVSPDYIYVPPLIIQPFVENAIWHGLLHKETAGHLSISFSTKVPNVLQCIVEDNGIGRDKAKELKSKSTSTKKSLGMKLTEDRLALLNKQTMLEATAEILDLKDITGQATGTKVILKIPFDTY
jgi:LytS/YehU family sensor histidine kinase